MFGSMARKVLRLAGAHLRRPHRLPCYRVDLRPCRPGVSATDALFY